MTKFAKGNDSFFINFHQVVYSLSSISLLSLKLLAVTVLICPNLQRAIIEKNVMMIFNFTR